MQREKYKKQIHFKRQQNKKTSNEDFYGKGMKNDKTFPITTDGPQSE